MWKRSNSPLLCGTALAVFAGGCIQGFESSSAYEDQRALCSDDYADVRQELFDECAASQADADPCYGVVSFSGMLEGTPLTVESLALSTSFRAQQQRNGAVALDRVDVTGASPYFVFSLVLGSVGGSVVGSGARSLVLDSAAELESDHLGDDLASVTLRLEAASESVALRGLPESGTLVIEGQTINEIRGRFDGAFGSADDELEGCFRVLAEETVLDGA
jgi:hypothetical protein